MYELRIATASMSDLRPFRRRSFAQTGFVAFAISATVIGTLTYLSLYVQKTLGYSPGPRRAAVPAAVPGLLRGRPPDRPADRQSGDAGAAWGGYGRGRLASMAHLTATSTWLVLLPGFIACRSSLSSLVG